MKHSFIIMKQNSGKFQKSNNPQKEICIGIIEKQVQNNLTRAKKVKWLHLERDNVFNPFLFCP